MSEPLQRRDIGCDLLDIRHDVEYELAGLATQQVQIAFSASSAGLLWHPGQVAVTAGQTLRLDLQVPS